MDIRAATPADMPDLLQLIAGMAAHLGDAAQADAGSLARDVFGPHAFAAVLLARDIGANTQSGAQVQGEALGYALVLPLMRAHLGQRGMDLHHVFVREGARGAGIGTALLREVRALALARGCSYLTVSTQEDGADARDFYVQRGFIHAPPAPWRFAMDLSRG